MPDHPYADCKGFVYEHRFVLEQKIGRYLKPGEIAHHIDGSRDNNEPENLAYCKDQNEHLLLHKNGALWKKK